MEKTDRITEAIHNYFFFLFLLDDISLERVYREECIGVDYAYEKIQEAKSYILNSAGVSASNMTAEAFISAFTKDLGCSRNEFMSALSEYIKNIPGKAWEYLTVDRSISPEEAIDFILQKHFK